MPPMALGLGLGATFGGSASVQYSAEATTLFAAMSSQPSDARKALIDTYIGALKTAGVWTALDVLYIMAAHDAQAAQLNWKNPGTFDLIAVNSPTFATDRGYTGNGSSSRLRTQFTPSTNGVNYVRDNASLWAWVLDNSVVNVADMGNSSAGADASRLVVRGTGDVLTGRVNSNLTTAASATVATSVGMSGITRAVIGTIKYFKDGAQYGTNISNTSTGVDAVEQWVCGGNSTGFSTHQMALAAWGNSLAGKEAAFYSASLAYMQGVGAA